MMFFLFVRFISMSIEFFPWRNVAPSHAFVSLEGMETNMGCSENWCIFGSLGVQSRGESSCVHDILRPFHIFPESSLEIS